jgi:hypothetical protein
MSELKLRPPKKRIPEMNTDEKELTADGVAGVRRKAKDERLKTKDEKRLPGEKSAER